MDTILQILLVLTPALIVCSVIIIFKYPREVEVPKLMVRDQTKARSLQPGNPYHGQNRKQQGGRYQKHRALNVTPSLPLTPVDQTKRRQPGNFALPNGIITDQESNKLRAMNIGDKQNLTHRFFGTMLEVRSKVIVHGLDRRMHQLEVVDGLAYIDGRMVQIHPNDIDNLIKDLRDDA